MHVTRRSFTTLIALSLGLGSAGLPRVSHAAPSDYAQMLQDALDALGERLACGTRLYVTGFELLAVPSKGIEMVAHVHMAWAPGERQIPFTVQADDANAAFKRLEAGIFAHIVHLHQVVAPVRGGPIALA